MERSWNKVLSLAKMLQTDFELIQERFPVLKNSLQWVNPINQRNVLTHTHHMVTTYAHTRVVCMSVCLYRPSCIVYLALEECTQNTRNLTPQLSCQLATHTCLSFYLPVHLSTCPSVCLSVSLSVCLSFCQPVCPAG